MIRKFNTNSDFTLEKLQTYQIYEFHEALKNANNFNLLSKDLKTWFQSFSNELWQNELYNHGICKIRGWEFDFREFMNEYWVETELYGIVKIFSFNKTLIRKNAIHPEQIIKIVEIEKQQERAILGMGIRERIY